MFRHQLERCWRRPPRVGSDAAGVRVEFIIELTREGRLDGQPVVLPGSKPATSDYAQAYQNSALRAITECQPYTLPAEYYDEWKKFQPVFMDAPPPATRKGEPGMSSPTPASFRFAEDADRGTPSPRPACGERSDRIARCDPGEGVQVSPHSQLAEAAPHPNPLPVRTGRGREDCASVVRSPTPPPYAARSRPCRVRTPPRSPSRPRDGRAGARNRPSAPAISRARPAALPWSS
ncbi:hypothetical protein ACVWZM_002521 [Bradyrhizobium sp. USDA 4501]